MTVLIADNDRAVSGLLSEVLQHSGLRAAHAYDGDEASRLARDPSVRVLVCDLDMPGASGVEVLESLRDLERPPHAMVISGYLDAGIEARLRQMPYVHEVMRKPFDLLVFAQIVQRLAGLAGAQAAESGHQAGSGHQPGSGREGEPEQAASASSSSDGSVAGSSPAGGVPPASEAGAAGGQGLPVDY